MFKEFFSKWFNRSAPQAPKAFKEKIKKNIFLNRYASILYFIVAWHAFGYSIAAAARNKAAKEGKLRFFCLFILILI
jgi:hypothetical protein